MKECARKTKNCSGADIEGFVREAFERLFNENKDKKDHDSLLRFLDDIIDEQSISIKKKRSIRSVLDKYKNSQFKNASESKIFENFPFLGDQAVSLEETVRNTWKEVTKDIRDAPSFISGIKSCWKNICNLKQKKGL